MKLVYGVKDRPKPGRLVLFSLQQLLAILAATIAVPMIIGNGMQPSAALFGAGVGTIVYLLLTRFKSPVFLGSSFAFLGSMGAAFAGGVSMSLGYLGLIIGAVFAGLVYVIIAVIVKFAGTKWIDKIMPAVVIGPTVAIIGLSLAGNAVGDLMSGSATYPVTNWFVDFENAVNGAPLLSSPRGGGGSFLLEKHNPHDQCRGAWQGAAQKITTYTICRPDKGFSKSRTHNCGFKKYYSRLLKPRQ